MPSTSTSTTLVSHQAANIEIVSSRQQSRRIERRDVHCPLSWQDDEKLKNILIKINPSFLFNQNKTLHLLYISSSVSTSFTSLYHSL